MAEIGSRGTLLKYVALQLPGLVLVGGGLALAIWLFGLSYPLAGAILGLWVLKDAVMYPIVRIAYEPGEPDPSKFLVGARGTARERIDPEGWVKIGSELWRARLTRDAAPIEGGAPVRVVAIRGFTLEIDAPAAD